LWLIGGDDILLVASNGQNGDIEARLKTIDRAWQRPGVAADLAAVAAIEPFSVASLLAAGAPELASYTANATILTDDRMALEFSGPRALHTSSAEENGAALSALSGGAILAGPDSASEGQSAESADKWQRRGAMMFKADAYASAYQDYRRALTLDFTNNTALDGLVRSAVLAGRATEAAAWLKEQGRRHPATARHLVAISKLQASTSLGADALETARQATRLFPADADAFEQLASVLSDAGETSQLDEAVARLRTLAPIRASTFYFGAVSAFVRGRLDDAVRLAERAIATDAAYGPVYDLVGAAYTKLDRPADAKKAFETSLQLDAHDSTAYTNLGLLELAGGNRAAAANYFAEALELAPDSPTAREGLARTR
jgi:Flp pilus assembly protein TadD